jgi:hypothetical protein
MNSGHLEDENRLLAERLEKLTKLSKKIIRPKKDFYLDPVRKKDITKEKDNYDGVESKMDYEKLKYHGINKQRKLKQRKKEKEMANCTFKPKLNKRSKKMVRNVNYVRPHDKELLRKKEKESRQEEDNQNEGTTFNDIMKQLDIEEDESVEMKQNKKTPKKKIKKINEDFYNKQLKWLNRKQQIAEKQRLENAMKEYSEVKNVPKTNKKKNQKLLKNRKKLVDRIGDETLKSKMKKEKLQKKYNKATFKPKINRNYKVKSKVRENLGKQNAIQAKKRQERNKNKKFEQEEEPQKNEEYENEHEEYEEYEEYYEEEYEHDQ